MKNRATRSKRGSQVLGLLLIIGAFSPSIWSQTVPPTSAKVEPPQGMVYVPAQEYRPLFRSDNDPKVIAGPLFVDIYPVTRGAFLAFIQANPRWQRSKVSRLFADEGYLADWKAELSPNPDDPDAMQRPVTRISWFAAMAYCRWRGKRLPTVAEWETVAAASKTQAWAGDDKEYLRVILDWYGRPTANPLPKVGSTFANLWGVQDLHGLVWEWVADFGSVLVSGESRGDSALERGLFCGAGAVGASDFKDYAAFMRFGLRGSLMADYTVANLGCRCVQGVADEAP